MPQRSRKDSSNEHSRHTANKAAPSDRRKNEDERRPSTDDEKIDEAVIESFGTSDPPSYTPMRVGSPPEHKQRKSETKANNKKKGKSPES